MAASEGAMAARPLARARATSRAASAVELDACTSTPGSLVASQSRHWALAWGMETTVFTSDSFVPGLTHRLRSTGTTISRWMNRCSDASKASVSSVSFTDPSMAFSIGTTPSSARPESTSKIVSAIDRMGTCSPAARSGWESSACSVNVPEGPRNATRGGAAEVLGARGEWAGGDIAGHPM